MVSGIGGFIFILLFLIYPFYLTYVNVKLFLKADEEKCISDFVTCVFGGFCWSLLVAAHEISEKYWSEPVYVGSKHELLSSKYTDVIWIAAFFTIAAFLILIFVNPKNFTPILSAFSISMSAVGLVIFLLINIQLMGDYNFLDLMAWLYYANLLLVFARRTRVHIIENVRIANDTERVYRSKFAEKLAEICRDISKMTSFCFMMILPIAVIIEVLYILFGQGADGFIKAFTDTADWTFSMQQPPPPLEYDGHYLCTVAAGGHKKLVKPLRYGKRGKNIILVNRQLAAANAFEDLIAERVPKIHRKIRNFYNKYGYPISKHITTPLRADIVYILMKPLEWLFVFVLYLFDKQPENRIAVQYSDYKK
ncbi:MAG: hypothetical protein IJM19_03175 [Ruminococcus sp.]|nr:hypothetical protein [Ruminococcus sp.]